MRVRTIDGMAPLVALGLLAACGGDGGRAANRWAGTVDTVGTHTVVVHNPASPMWDSATAWHLERTVRIGAADGAGADVFGRIMDAQADDAGNLYVLESQASEIRVFDASGAYVRTIGHEGAGPGEMRTPIGMVWDGPGRLLVVDPRNARYTVFDTTGAVVDEYRRPMSSSSVPWPGGIGPDGDLYDYTFTMRPGQEARRSLVRIERTDDATAPIDTVLIPESPEPEQKFELRTGDGFITAAVPFASRFIWTFDRRGFLWLASTGRYRIYRTDLTGDTLAIIERAFEPVPVTSEEKQEAIDGFDWFVRQGGHVDASRIPDTKPPIQNLMADDDGYLWVRTAAAGADGSAPAAWDVFDPDGRWLGTIDGLPSRIFRIRGGRILAMETDESGVPYVATWVVRRP